MDGGPFRRKKPPVSGNIIQKAVPEGYKQQVKDTKQESNAGYVEGLLVYFRPVCTSTMNRDHVMRLTQREASAKIHLRRTRLR